MVQTQHLRFRALQSLGQDVDIVVRPKRILHELPKCSRHHGQRDAEKKARLSVTREWARARCPQVAQKGNRLEALERRPWRH